MFFALFIILPMLSLSAMHSDSDDENDIFTRRLPRELQIRVLSESFKVDFGFSQSNRCLSKKPEEVFVPYLSSPPEPLQLNTNN